MNACQLTASITAATNAMASSCSDQELALLAAVFVHLGDTLATILTCRGACSPPEPKS